MRPSQRRVQVTLSQQTYQALKELSDATGDSMSGIVAHFMDEAAQAFPSIIAAFQTAKSRPIEAMDLMAEQLAKAQAAASQGQLDLVEMRRRQYKRRAKK